MKRKNIFWFFYFASALFFVVPVFLNVLHSLKILGNVHTLLFFSNFVLRIFGVLMLFLLFVQVLIGAYNSYLSRKFGNWVINLHIWQGKIIYALIVLHTFSLLLFNFVARKGFDPFYVFVDFCLICQTKQELFYSLGRFGFWLLTLTVLAGLLRKKSWWKENWRYFHILNYLLFFLISAHAHFVGSDFSLKVGYLGYLNLVLLFFVLFIVLQKLAKWFAESFRWK